MAVFGKETKLSLKLQGYPFLYESSLIRMLMRSSALGNIPKRSAATGVREGVVPGAASSTPRLHRLIHKLSSQKAVGKLENHGGQDSMRERPVVCFLLLPRARCTVLYGMRHFTA